MCVNSPLTPFYDERGAAGAASEGEAVNIVNQYKGSHSDVRWPSCSRHRMEKEDGAEREVSGSDVFVTSRPVAVLKRMTSSGKARLPAV